MASSASGQTAQPLLRDPGVRLVEASAYLGLTLPVVHYRTAGLRLSPDGQVVAPNRVIAKVSRVEVATRFLSPPPDRLLAELVRQARAGDVAFRAAVEQAERLAASAGAPQSEGWVAAQQALSTADAAREPTGRALGDIDALGAERLQTQGGLAPNDLAAIQAAGAEVGAIDQRQAERIAAIQRRLGAG